MCGKLPFESGDERAGLFVDGALAAEVAIVLRHFEHALTRHILPAQYVLEERDHVLLLLRPAKGDDEYGVVGLVRRGHRLMVAHRACTAKSRVLLTLFHHAADAIRFNICKVWPL